MKDIILDTEITIPNSALTFKFSRSSGKGGQNVNKVSTKVELLFHVDKLRTSNEIMLLIKQKLQNKIDSKGILRITSQQSRSQWQNKQESIEKLSELILQAAFVDRFRVATKPTHSSKIQRVDAKKKTGKRKESRRKNINRDED